MYLTDFNPIYFVCIGNTCRSPMAAALLQHKLAERCITGITVRSRGLNPFIGRQKESCSEETRSVLANYLDDVSFLDDHTATLLAWEDFRDVKDNDGVLITMDRLQKECVQTSSLAGKEIPLVYTLGELAGRKREKIYDPALLGGRAYLRVTYPGYTLEQLKEQFGKEWLDNKLEKPYEAACQQLNNLLDIALERPIGTKGKLYDWFGWCKR